MCSNVNIFVFKPARPEPQLRHPSRLCCPLVYVCACRSKSVQLGSALSVEPGYTYLKLFKVSQSASQ